MLGVLRNPVFRRLFAAQVVALLGTGLLTVALGLLAFDLAQEASGAVMGTAMTIKMVAYVGAGPVLAALTANAPPKAVLVTADLLRAAGALALPWVHQSWQIYLLIFLLQCASATFTPAFQALIPAVLPEEREYTRALSLSRLAYDVEALASPIIAGALLGFMSYHFLFVGTAGGFVASTLLVLTANLPKAVVGSSGTFRERLTLGVRVFGARRELRALAALNLVVAAATAMVIVNTAVLVRGPLGRGQADVASLLGAYGAGSMLVALAIPQLLDRLPERHVLLAGAVALPALLLAAAGTIEAPGPGQWVGLLTLWTLLGAANSAILTPSARLLRRNSDQGNRQAVFAAQFSLSHACFLASYPLAGAVGAALGLAQASAALALLGAFGVAMTVAALLR